MPCGTSKARIFLSYLLKNAVKHSVAPSYVFREGAIGSCPSLFRRRRRIQNANAGWRAALASAVRSTARAKRGFSFHIWGPGPRAGGLLEGLLLFQLTMDYQLTCLRPPPPPPPTAPPPPPPAPPLRRRRPLPYLPHPPPHRSTHPIRPHITNNTHLTPLDTPTYQTHLALAIKQ